MKKFFIGLAGAGLCCAAAAQSSLILYGTVDTRLALGSGSVSDTKRLGTSGNQSSRLGFRGTEDLGSGMAASFWLEADINTDDGTGVSTNANNQGTAPVAPVGSQGLVFNRRSTVSLSGPVGEVRVGRDYSPTFWNVASADPFGNVGVGVTQATTGQRAGPTFARTSNGIAYHLPSQMSGFYGQLQYYLGENPSGTATERDGTGLGVRVGWAGGPVDIAAARSKTRFAAGDIVTTNYRLALLVYSIKLTASYGTDRVDGASPDGKAWLLGVVAPFGPGEFKASISKSSTDAAGNPAGRKVAVGYVHNLSKRTALYVTAAHIHNSGGATFALNGAVTAANQHSRGYDFGIRHHF